MPLRCISLRSIAPAAFVASAVAAALLPAPLSAQLPGSHPAIAPLTIEKTVTGFTAISSDEIIELTVCGDSTLHYVARQAKTSGAIPAQPWMLAPAQSCPGAPFTFSLDAKQAILTTAKVKVTLARDNGAITYSTMTGDTLLRERPEVSRTYKPSEANGDHAFEVQDRFSPDATEGFYGLGQHQGGVFNYRGNTVELAQNNTDVAIPFLVSTKGYAILWNTAAFSYADNRFPLEFSFTSSAESNIDYFLLFGPEMDQMIYSYRNLTGHTPLLPRWAYGLFQSKDRYNSTTELVDVADRIVPRIFRSMPLCRTGSGGRRRAIRSSTPTTTTFPAT